MRLKYGLLLASFINSQTVDAVPGANLQKCYECSGDSNSNCYMNLTSISVVDAGSVKTCETVLTFTQDLTSQGLLGSSQDYVIRHVSRQPSLNSAIAGDEQYVSCSVSKGISDYLIKCIIKCQDSDSCNNSVSTNLITKIQNNLKNNNCYSYVGSNHDPNPNSNTAQTKTTSTGFCYSSFYLNVDGNLSNSYFDVMDNNTDHDPYTFKKLGMDTFIDQDVTKDNKETKYTTKLCVGNLCNDEIVGGFEDASDKLVPLVKCYSCSSSKKSYSSDFSSCSDPTQAAYPIIESCKVSQKYCTTKMAFLSGALQPNGIERFCSNVEQTNYNNTCQTFLNTNNYAYDYCQQDCDPSTQNLVCNGGLLDNSNYTTTTTTTTTQNTTTPYETTVTTTQNTTTPDASSVLCLPLFLMLGVFLLN